MFRISSVVLAILLAAAAGSLQAAGDGQGAGPGQAVHAAAKTLVEGHISHRPLNDELSRAWFNAFFLRLDPRRMYFLATDLREFESSALRLDDWAREGSFEFPLLVRRRLRERVAEAAKEAEAAIRTDHDYTLDESVPRRYETFAASAQERDRRWRLRIKLEMLIEKNHGREVDEVRTQLYDRYRRIDRQARELSEVRLCQAYLSALAKLYDPHAAYMSPEERERYEMTIRLRSYTLRLGLRDVEGKLLIGAYPGPYRSPLGRFKGWELSAVRRVDGPLVDVVEMHSLDVGSIISRCDGPLGDDATAVLELMNPRTLERVTLEVPRLRS